MTLELATLMMSCVTDCSQNRTLENTSNMLEHVYEIFSCDRFPTLTYPPSIGWILWWYALSYAPVAVKTKFFRSIFSFRSLKVCSLNFSRACQQNWSNFSAFNDDVAFPGGLATCCTWVVGTHFVTQSADKVQLASHRVCIPRKTFEPNCHKDTILDKCCKVGKDGSKCQHKLSSSKFF